MADIDSLGAPSLKLGTFVLWVHGRQYPDSEDAWDGNWLNVTAHCGASGSRVVVSGAVLDTASLARWRTALRALHERLDGQAILESDEPNVKVTVSARGRTGQMDVRVDMTPDFNQGHWFEFDVDQTHLPETLAQCDRLLREFPVRDARARGL